MFTSSPGVAVGDSVLVSGTARDFCPLAGGESLQTTSNLSVTEIGSPTVTVVSHGNALPAPEVISPATVPDGYAPDLGGANIESTPVTPARSALDFWASREGVRVEVDDARVVGASNDFGEQYVTTKPTQARTFRGGAELLGENQIPSGRVEVVHANGSSPGGVGRRRVLRRDDRAGRLVAVRRLHDRRAVEEVQDDTGATDDGVVVAGQTLAKLRDAIVAAGGPRYDSREIDPVNDQDGGQPGGNIRVVFLFDPARVSFVDRGAAGVNRSTTGTAIVKRSGGPSLTLSPGRIDPTNPLSLLRTGTASGSAPSILTDLISTLPLDRRYTYVFNGVSQVLDHILVSSGVRGVEYEVVHINADYADQVSDHDPQVVRLQP